MNCKPGEWAIVAGVRRLYDRPYLGCVLRVERVEVDAKGVAYWSFTGNRKLDAAGMDRVADQFLRPLRDAGDDALDESLGFAGTVPSAMQLDAQMRAARESWDAVARFTRFARTQGRAR